MSRKCSRVIPEAMRLEGVPYLDRYVIYCDCGLTIFGNTKDLCEQTWRKHKAGNLK